jgi:hypothetical protein
MTPDPYQRLLDAFGRDLEQAATRPVPPRLRIPHLAAAVAVVVAGVTAALLATPDGDNRVDAVAQARAALAPPAQQLVHLVVRQTFELRSGRGALPSTMIEQWAASDPPRWRIAWKAPGGGALSDAYGPIAGPVQIAYAAGTQSTYVRQRNTLTLVHGFTDADVTASVAGPTLLGNDPIAGIRAMLNRGELRNAGRGSVDGRAVWRLVGALPVQRDGKTLTTRLEYDVNRVSYAPVAARVQLPVPASSPPSALALRFPTFQRLPLTAANARLLQIRPQGRPKVIEQTVAQARAQALDEAKGP